MKVIARWAWVVVLGTALALSWWSLDVLARHYGMPPVFAAMVSATFDGAALVGADLALKRAQVADSAAAVKLLMLATVSLSAWLNFEHGALLGYPVAVRVLFAGPSVIGGSLFELQLRSLHRNRLHEMGRIARPLPRFGFMVWTMHPLAAAHRVRQITASRLHSVPLSVIDWTGAPTSPSASAPEKTALVSAPELEASAPEVRALEARASLELPAADVIGAAGAPESVRALERAAGDAGESEPTPASGARLDEGEKEAGGARQRQGRKTIPDEYYLGKLRELAAAADGVVPSAREAARLLSIGQDRARRVVAQLQAERSQTPAGDAA